MAYWTSHDEAEARMRRTKWWKGTALLLAACAARPVKAPLPESYTGETTYAKLPPRYAFIRISSRTVPP